MVTYVYIIVNRFWSWTLNTGGVLADYQRANAKDDVGAQVVIRALV